MLDHFELPRQLEPMPFELELPTIMKVHPLFNATLLHNFQGEPRPPGPIIVDGEAVYEVEKIVRHRGNGKHCQYLVRWLEYDES